MKKDIYINYFTLKAALHSNRWIKNVKSNKDAYHYEGMNVYSKEHLFIWHKCVRKCVCGQGGGGKFFFSRCMSVFILTKILKQIWIYLSNHVCKRHKCIMFIIKTVYWSMVIWLLLILLISKTSKHNCNSALVCSTE